MYKFLVVLALIGAIQAGGYGTPNFDHSSSSEKQNDPTVKCYKDVTFQAYVNSEILTVNCSDPITDTSEGVSLADRCIGCCDAWAFAKRYQTENTIGFVSNTGTNCVCCRKSKSRRGRRYD